VAGARRPSSLGSRRTLKLLAFAGVAYFVFWSPTVVVSLGQCFVGSFRPPPAVEFAAVWLANANSALYVIRRRRNGGGDGGARPRNVETTRARVSCRRRNTFPHFCTLFVKLPLFVVMLPTYN